MAFVLFPAQLGARSDLYHQVGSSVSAGLPLVKTLELLARNPPSRSLRRPLERIIAQLHSGRTFAEAVRSLGSWAPEFDVALIEAGEASGRLDYACRLLSRAYQERARLTRRVLLGLAYPVLLFHVAFLIMPIGALIALVQEGDVAGFIIGKLVFFVPFYLGVLLIIYAAQSSRGRAWRSLLETISGFVPYLGKARRALALSRLSLALESLFNAGVPATRAWPLAATASASPAIEREVNRWRDLLESGESAGDIILASGTFPPHFSSIYATSERAGRVDEALTRLSEHYQEEGLRLMRIAAAILTGLVYGMVMLVAVYQIMTFWVGHYDRILGAGGE